MEPYHISRMHYEYLNVLTPHHRLRGVLSDSCIFLSVACTEPEVLKLSLKLKEICKNNLRTLHCTNKPLIVLSATTTAKLTRLQTLGQVQKANVPSASHQLHTETVTHHFALPEPNTDSHG